LLPYSKEVRRQRQSEGTEGAISPNFSAMRFLAGGAPRAAPSGEARLGALEIAGEERAGMREIIAADLAVERLDPA
jgi:hypothetical protein